MNKIELVKENKDAIVAAFNFYLDFLDGLLPEDSSTLEENVADLPDNLKEVLKSSYERVQQYESIRQKIINNDFNLSTVELDYTGLMLFFWGAMTKNHIAKLQKAVEIAADLEQQFLSPNKAD